MGFSIESSDVLDLDSSDKAFLGWDEVIHGQPFLEEEAFSGLAVVKQGIFD
jgi:hypothetical protein